MTPSPSLALRCVATRPFAAVLALLATLSIASCTVGPSPKVARARIAFTPYAFSTSPATSATFTRLGWQNYTSPEYTDDQRFTDSNGVYGPIAHIAPSDSLRYLNTVADFDLYGDTGFVAGVIKIDTTAGSVLPSTYTALNVAADFNCVRLSHRASGWFAVVTPLAPVGPPCPPSTTATPLPVQRVVSAAFPTSADVPAVARFHEGRTGANMRAPLFGLKCAEGWCIAVPSGTDTLPVPQAGVNAGVRGWFVHGWGDAQHLGVPNGSTKHIEASMLANAAVIPDPGLGRYSIPSNFDTGWVHVATVRFGGNPNSTAYGSKWHYRGGNNEVFIRTSTSSTTGWTGEVRNVTHFLGIPITHRYTVIVNRTPHTGLSIPGTSRFWWYDDDEGLWVRCDEGCCQVAPSGES